MEAWERLVWKGFFTISTCLLLSVASFSLEPQAEQEVQTVLSACMEQARQGVLADECDMVYTLGKEYGSALVPYLEKYVTDPNRRVRWKAYAFMFELGLDVNDVVARQKIVERLVTGVRDDLDNRGHLANWLVQFTSADFSNASKELVRQLFVSELQGRGRHFRRKLILLAGAADLKSELPRLKEFVDEHEDKLKQQHEEYLAEWRRVVERKPERMRARYARHLMKQYWQNSLVWAAVRARARMGVKEDIKRCIELVESHPDEGYRVRRL
jgi:HEAT repeat protein